MRLSSIDDNLTIYKNKSVVIWGASSAGRKMYQLLKGEGINIIAFCDSNSNKWETKYCNLDIISPDELEKMNNESILIQIASEWEKEIADELKRRKVENFLFYSEAYGRLLNLKKYQLAQTHKDLYYRYLDGKFYFPVIYEWEDMLPLYDCSEVVLLCLPTKTGDHTLMYTLDRYGVPYMNLWHAPFRYTKEFEEIFAEKKIKIITATRDTVGQNLSLLFEVMDLVYWDCEEYWKDGGNLDALFSRWISDLYEYEAGKRQKRDAYQAYRDYLEITWGMRSFYEKEFSDFFGINLYDYAFDKEKGYSIIKVGNKEIFIYQVEKLNEIYKDLLSFLNITDGELVLGNCAHDKWYSRVYKEAIKNIHISECYYEECYSDKYLHHFYSEEDINGFKEKWANNI